MVVEGPGITGFTKPCLVVGSMVAEPYPPCLSAAYEFLPLNLNDKSSFEELGGVMSSIQEFFEHQLGFRGFYAVPTYGGSESTLTALYVLREKTGGNKIVVSRAAHQSVYKAARILGLRTIVVPVDGFDRIDVSELRRVLGREREGVAGVVATLGTTDLGSIDDISGVVEVAEEAGIPVYLDAAFGGFPLSLAKGIDVFRARSSVVAGIGMDLHKFLSSPPAGFLLIREELAGFLRFPAPYMPEGFQESLLWTRSGFGAGFLYSCVKLLGLQGLREIALELLGKTRAIHDYARSKGLAVMSMGETPMLVVRPQNRSAISSSLRRRRIVLYPSSRPGSLRMIIKWCHSLGFLRRIVDVVSEHA